MGRDVSEEVGLRRWCEERVERVLVVLLLLGWMPMLEPVVVLRFVFALRLFGGPVEAAGRRLRVWWKRVRRTEGWDMFGILDSSWLLRGWSKIG
jgi:hypothetical protein